jgi:hypothetical protein
MNLLTSRRGRLTLHALIMTAALALTLTASAAQQGGANPFVGDWALTVPGGGPGWLGVNDEGGGKLSAQVLWVAGSVLPAESAKVEGDKLIVTRVERGRGGAATTETITATVRGDEMSLTTVKKRPDGSETGKASFTGKRQAPLPPRPDLSKVKFGEPIQLFNGHDLSGWRLTDPKAVSGWSVKEGVLTNNPAQEPGTAHKNYGNLRTEREFEDFNLKTELMVPKGGNSGIYLRGIYEIQVADTFGRKLDPHNMGALYSRLTPSESAEKPAGEWQTIDITLVDRHLTVVLNGKTIIDDQPVRGCTGGALWSDVTRPGPIYLQGDHTVANYRNMVLRPVVK